MMERECASLSALLDKVTQSNSEMTRDLKLCLEQKDKAVQDLVKMQVDVSKNLKLLSNWQAVQAGAYQVPFPDVHIPVVMPESNGTMQPLPTPRTARSAQQDAVAESRKKAFELRDRLKAEADTIGLNNL